jgi:ABC-type glycerol-3-phosphate transport system substrate-binding protein
MRTTPIGRLLTVLCALALALGLLGACGGDDDDGGSASTTAPGGTEPAGGATTVPAGEGGAGGEGLAALPDLNGQAVTVLGKWSGEEQAAFEQVIAAFEEETGADVTYSSGGDNIATVLGTAIQGGSPPDVAVLPQPGLLVDQANAGTLQPASEEVSTLVDTHFPPAWRELGSVDGELYGVWFKAANKSTMWYRPDLFEAAGITEPPEAWEDFLADAAQVSASGVTPISIGGADGWTLTDWFENVYLRTAGPDKYDQLASHEIPWTDPSVIEALTLLGELWSDQSLISGGTATALQNGFTESVTRVFSAENTAAIVYEGDFVAGVISENTDFEPGEQADYFPFPSVNGSEPAVVGGGDVAVRLTENPAGEAFMQYLAMPESAEVWAEQGGFTSPNKDVDPAVYPDDITRRSAEQLVNAETFRFDLSDLQPAAFGSTEGSGMWGLFQELLSNPTQIQPIAQQLEAAAVAAYGG